MAAESPQSHGADTAHTTTTEAEHGSGGLPQFQFQHWGGQIAYLPERSYAGPVTLTYTVRDAAGHETTARVAVQVEGLRFLPQIRR